MLITVATTLLFFEMTHVTIRDNNRFLPRKVQAAAAAAAIRANLDLILSPPGYSPSR